MDSHIEHNYNIKDNILIFFIIDTANCGDLPIAVKILPLYVNNQFMYYSIDDIEDMANAEDMQDRTSFRSDMLNLPAGLVNSNIELGILGAIYIVNPIDTDGYTVEDMRVYGGGTTEQHRSFNEYSFYDGEAADPELYLKLHMKENLFNDLVSRIYKWDPEVVKLEGTDNKDSLARQKATELIKKKMVKFTQLGANSELIIDAE